MHCSCRALWEELDGFDERFQSPGGGLVNHDTLRRALELPDVQPVTLLGEANFHQVHGGIATNAPPAARDLVAEKYARIRGRSFCIFPYNSLYVGCIDNALVSIPQSAGQCSVERNIPPHALLPAVPRDTTMRRTSIVVLGTHRSGTSAIARLLNIAGTRLPKRLIPPGQYNKRDHWDPAEPVEFHNRLLSDLGSRRDDWRPLRLDSLTDIQPPNVKAAIREILSTDYGEAPLIVVKDPRICRLAPLVLEALDEAAFEVKIVMAIRNPLEVVASLMRRETEWSDKSRWLMLDCFGYVMCSTERLQPA